MFFLDERRPGEGVHLTSEGVGAENSTMYTEDKKPESEIFDPTRQGGEGGGGGVARQVTKERDEAREAVLKLEKELVTRVAALRESLETVQGLKEDYEADLFVVRKINDGLATENARLRAIFPKILESFGHTEVCGSGAAVSYLENMPAIVREAFRDATLGGQEARAGDELLGEAFHQITEEVAEHFGHRNCTTLQAVRLMNARLRELEAREEQREIMESWGD